MDSKGIDMCEYCGADEFLINNRRFNAKTDTYNGFEVWIEDDELNIYANLDKAKVVTASGSVKVKINYCPMCGRKLDV